MAPLATRVRHAAASYHASEAEGVKLVRERDQARRRYVRRYLNAEIDNPTLYDVTLNTGRFGFARAAEVIAQLALQHYHAFAERERAELAKIKRYKNWSGTLRAKRHNSTARRYLKGRAVGQEGEGTKRRPS